MITRVRATEIRRPMKSGSKDPILLRCNSPTGPIGVVAKLRGALPRDTFGLAIEFVAASFGKGLGRGRVAKPSDRRQWPIMARLRRLAARSKVRDWLPMCARESGYPLRCRRRKS